MNDFVEKDNIKSTLRAAVIRWKSGDIEENRMYTYRNDEGEFTYTVKGFKAMFHARKCRILVMQDQTAFERLAKLDKKYQKLYVASIAHSIRTPLNGIVGMLDMLDSRDWNQDEARYLTVAKHTCELLNFLISNIVDYSQMDEQSFCPHLAMVSVRTILNEVRDLFSFSFQQRRLSAFFECDQKTPELLNIDKERYKQILVNLLENALKFTTEGRISVLTSYEEDRDLLVTSVTDTGIGIKREEVPKLFRLFGKVDNPAELHPQGIGFGLSVCKKLSEFLGGKITVNSQLGEGSTFTFSVSANLRGEICIEDVASEFQKEEVPSEDKVEHLDTSSRMVPGEIMSRVQEHHFLQSTVCSKLRIISVS